MRKKCIPCGTPPTPYYKGDKNSVTQDHASVYRDTAYAAGVLVPEEFTIPAIGEDIQVCSKELVNIVVGSYFWNPAYGYLKVVHFDSCTGKIGLLNDDIQGAAIPGTVVGAGSLWTVTARPCCADQDTFSVFPFLAEDYVIPGVGNPVTLQVTSTFGLIEGTIVRIGANVYLLDQINSSLEIVVINEGAGGIPGTTVEARDVNGNLQYLITQAVASVCSSPGANVVRLTGCDGSTEAVLEGDWVGQVPVLQDPTTEEVAFYLLDTEVRTCTSLIAPVNVLSATPSYTIEVADESIFAIGQILQLDFGSLRWEITDNTTPNELDIICTTGNPGSDFTIPAGTPVCLQLTTDTLQDEIDDFPSDYLALDGSNEGLLAANTIGLNKLQNISGNTLVGSSSLGGVLQQIGVEQGIDFSGSNTIKIIDKYVTYLDTGWMFQDTEVVSYLSANSVTVTSDARDRYQKGDKLRLINNSVTKYYIIRNVTSTVITLAGDDYLSPSDVSDLYLSRQQDPFGFPAWFDFSPTYTGFSTPPDVPEKWRTDGTMCTYHIPYGAGTSDTNDFTIQLPIPAITLTGMSWGVVPRVSVDSGVVQSTPAQASILSGGSVIFVTRNINGAGGTWTNSGDKGVGFTIVYEF